ncbi:ABC-2 type transport system permease protein [Jeotgalicoccus aerolatus]|uniref:ABC-2 type transport system permease protein n=1 Tax=Jeotgalicoccus aerolatus TaxID=709510 RepID=A0A1G9B664_9STAP|nr:ABC transporter permease [Jeotgalicoccus aerolatus]SDK35046.1 ABC-2 type transport system permease protein [Jeotgalicoccus aerolatus]
MNITRVMAIFEKDLKEFMKNMMLFTSVMIPIIMALFFTRIGGGQAELPPEMLVIVVGVVFTAVSFSAVMTMIAEENEKDTLRGLLQSPTTIIDIILGKSMVVGLMTIISLVASILIISPDNYWTLENIISLILMGFFFLCMGIGIGLIVNSVATTSVYLIPIMFIFGFTPYIEMIITDPDHIAIKIAEYFPLYQNLNILNGESGAMEFVILAAWAAASFLLVLWAFNKRKNDE